MKQIHKDYHKGPKGNWRRTMWNFVCNNLPIHPKDALVLYLAGNQDLDRPEALRRRFKPDNLISVERERPIIKKLRSARVLCVAGEFLDVAENILKKRRLDVIFGDFCGGINTEECKRIIAMTLLENTKGCVFAFNFQRGRDDESNKSRENLLQSSQKEFGALPRPEKHRGQMLLLFLTRVFRILAKESGTTTEEWRRIFPAWSLDSYPSDTINPKTGKRTRVIYDSVAFKLNIPEGIRKNVYAKPFLKPPVPPCPSLAPILAHRTMRLFPASEAANKYSQAGLGPMLKVSQRL